MKPLAWMPADHAVALDEADAGAGEVELLLAVDAGELGRLAAEHHAAGTAAGICHALDHLGDVRQLDAVCGDVVEHEQRLGAHSEHVVDAVRREVDTGITQPAGAPLEDQLGADAVGGGGQQAALVERVDACEAAEAADHGRRPRALDGRTQAVVDV